MAGLRTGYGALEHPGSGSAGVWRGIRDCTDAQPLLVIAFVPFLCLPFMRQKLFRNPHFQSPIGDSCQPFLPSVLKCPKGGYRLCGIVMERGFTWILERGYDEIEKVFSLLLCRSGDVDSRRSARWQ